MQPRTARPSSATALVGRGAALAALDDAVATAHAGRPTTVVVAGDPGIGKTTLVRSFLERAARHGDVVHCTAHEDTEIPYLMLVPLLDRFGIDRHRADSGSPLATNDAERLLFVDVLDALTARSSTTTVVIMLDDLHWADPASCSLVEFLTTSMADVAPRDTVRTLTVAVGRSNATGRAARLLDRLARGPAGSRLILDGLDETSVTEIARRQTGRRVSPTEARALQELTGGNPLMLELVLADAGTSASGGRYVSLSDQIEVALEGLGHDVRDVLEVAAVHGDPFTSGVVASVLGRELGSTLDQAEQQGIVVRRRNDVFFRHPELARHLRLQLGAARRAALHGTIGQVLLAEGELDGDRALVIDGHFRRGDGSEDLATRLDLAMRAGDRALGLGAWSRAMDAYGIVGKHLDTLDLDDAARARVALQAATAAIMDNQPGVARPLLDRSIELAAATGDAGVWQEAVLRSVRNRLSGERSDGRWSEVSALHQIIESDADDLTRVQAMVALADVAFVSHEEREGRRWCAEARLLAERSGAAAAIALAAYADGLQQLGALEVDLARDSFGRCVSSGSDDRVVVSWGLVRRPIAELLAGDLAAAAAHVEEAIAVTSDDQRWADQSLAELHRSALLALAGRLPEAEASAERALLLYERTGYGPTIALAVPQLVCVRAMRDDIHGIDDAFESWSSADWRPPRWLRPLAASVSGDELGSLALGPARALDLNSLLAYVARAELAPSTSPMEAATVAAGLQAAAERGVVWVGGWTASVTRALGTATAVLGDGAGAARWLELAETAAAGSPAELVQVWLRTAAVQRATGGAPERRSAATLCVKALELADRVGARGLARRARHELDVAPSIGESGAAPTLERTIMFTDIVGSTNLNVAVGDDTFIALLDEHNQAVREAARSTGGSVFHNTGDGYGIWFGAATDGVACGVAIHRALRRVAERHPRAAIRVRIGIAAGTPLPMDGDLFGVDVVRAARLCAESGAGQIALDARTAGLYDPTTLRCRPIGPVQLKGFPEPEPVYLADVTG